MKVVIVSKTKMSNGECVGGINLDTKQSIRLLTSDGKNQSTDCGYKIGQVWDIDYQTRYNSTLPHNEDVLISSASYAGNATQKNLSKYIIQNSSPDTWSLWCGNIDNLYNGLLEFTSTGSGFVSQRTGLPSMSVGFWIPNKDLILDKVYQEMYGKLKYSYPSSNGWRSVKYVGTDEPISKIPVQTLCRVSLARWWSPDEETEERCYLQLSGWYELKIMEEDDFPF